MKIHLGQIGDHDKSYAILLIYDNVILYLILSCWRVSAPQAKE